MQNIAKKSFSPGKGVRQRLCYTAFRQQQLRVLPMRPSGREANELREIKFTKGYTNFIFHSWS